MRAVRRHLRAGVAAWLLCHALTFLALLPRDCCAAHAHATRAAAASRDAAAGDGCPLHHAPAPLQDDCRLSGACDAPAAALAAVLLQGTAPLRPLECAPLSWVASAAPTPPVDVPLDRTLSPDAPPPRA